MRARRNAGIVVFVVVMGLLLGGVYLLDVFMEQEIAMKLEGEVVLDSDFTVTEHDTLVIEPGTHLLMGPNTRIIVNGKIIAKGTAETPIVFEGNGQDVHWRGIKINGLDRTPDIERFWKWIEKGDEEVGDAFFAQIEQGHVFEHCVFRNLATESKTWARINKWKGTIEAYDTSIRVSHCTFEDILHFGGVLTQRAYVVVNDCTFDDRTIHKAINSTDNAVGLFHNNFIKGYRTKNKRCADGIWMKSFAGLITSNEIHSVGDDGIDSDASYTVSFMNKVEKACDDGIDTDNAGLALIIDNTIDSVAENGILVSDESEAVLVRNTVTGCVCGVTLRDGGTVVTNENRITNNKTGVLLFQNIPCALTPADFQSVEDKLRSLSAEQIDEQEYIDGITSPEQLIAVLRNFYTYDGKYWRFNVTEFGKVSKLDNIKKIFKLVDVLEFEYITDPEVEAHPLREHLKNGIYLAGSVVKDNEEDVAVYHGYRMLVEGNQFTNDEVKAKVLAAKKCEPDYTCELVEKLNTSSVETNARRIVKRLVDAYGS